MKIERYFLTLLISFTVLSSVSARAAEYAGPVTIEDADAGAAGKRDTTLPGGRIKMSGRYRLAAAYNDAGDGVLNDSNADLQERNFRYMFGEHLENTFDPMVYDQFLLNTDFTPADRWNFHTKLVADPWSWVGQTGDQVQASDPNGGILMRYNLKYFGAFNSTLNEIYRNNIGDSYAFPIIKVHDGHTVRTRVEGFDDFDGVSGDGHGIPFTIPELDIDYEFRPVREAWVDYTEDEWSVRLFAVADQSQALSTDDPLELSNHRDYWQQSPWLYQYEPIQHYTDGSIRRGRYDDALSFLARDSEGNRLVLLRGASFQMERDNTFVAATVATPFTPWQDYSRADNVPGAVRVKQQMTDRWMLGGVYTFRDGFIDSSVADFNQVGSVDTAYRFDDETVLKAQVAASQRSRDLQTNDIIDGDTEGYATKAVLEKNFDHAAWDGHTDLAFTFAHMDEDFDPTLSRYTNTRDDHFWGKHLSFQPLDPALEHFRFGDGLDTNRIVVRAQWREKLFKERFMNVFDVRNVHKASNTAYKETVLNDEVTYHLTEKATVKGYFRWQGLPHTTGGMEPFISNFYFPAAGISDPAILQNTAILPDKDPSRFTYAAAVQYVFNPQWTAEGFVEVSNDASDFPRGLLNSSFRNANDRVDGLLIDHLSLALYDQQIFGLPPYAYDTTLRERVIYKPDPRVTLTFHAAQNDNKFAAGIDDNVNHAGLSAQFDMNEKLSFFADYTFSRLYDVPRIISSNFADWNFDGHHNVYLSMDYKIKPDTIFRAEYGVFGEKLYAATGDAQYSNPYSTGGFSLPVYDTEHLIRLSLTGEF